jgi:hypothetical protein
MPDETPTVGMQRKLAAIFSTDVAGYSRLMGDDEEATIRTLTAYRALISSLIQQSAHLTLATVYSELGQATEARAEAVEVLRINPKFSLEVHKQRMPIKDPAVLEQHIAALWKAGLK